MNLKHSGYKTVISGREVEQKKFAALLQNWKEQKYKIVSTNGCFDLIHRGHVVSLREARGLGDKLIVGLNSDGSVRRVKGAGRPILSEENRAVILSSLEFVDAVVIFDQDLPTGFIEFIQPDIHTKSGDYSEEALPEAETVKKNGGTVVILPLVEGISSSHIVQKISAADSDENENGTSGMSVESPVFDWMLDSSNLLRKTVYKLHKEIQLSGSMIIEVLKRGHKLLICGNGGSAADAQHIAAEFIGRFQIERNPFPAIALTTDSSILTAVGNDYGFDQIFSRQVEALGRPGDLFIGISTSGNSENVVRALHKAKEMNLQTLSFTGESPGKLSELSDATLSVPHKNTAKVQQAHITLLHLLCHMAESELSSK